MEKKDREHHTSNPFFHAALNYAGKFRFSVIPIRLDKKPYIKWEAFQQRCATREEITSWWKRWPEAMIGIITGTISGVVVIDIDTTEGNEEISQFIPESLLIPTSRTPNGGQHLYFKSPVRPIPNNARMVPGCDFRGEGGYVIAPPSINGVGKAYVWLEGLSLEEVDPPELPYAYISYLKNYFKHRGDNEENDNVINGRQKSSNVVKMLAEGRRDEDLFHIANLLVKGRMPYDQIKQVLEKLAKSCEPPFPLKEIPTKIESALKRAERRERNLAEEAREWVLSSSGVFLSSEIAQSLQVSSREEQKNLSKILSRFCEEGLIERHGNKNGCFRRIDDECEEIDFLNASTESLDIRWPFHIEQYVKTLPRNIIVIAGEPNAGKTAFLLNVVKMNMRHYLIYYFSSEMGPIELRDRLSRFDLPLSEWKFTPKERSSNFADVINPDAVNIIDYLEIHKDFWEVGGRIKEIYDKLKKGIAVIGLQKNKDTDYGLGKMRGLEKPRLYLAMEPGKIKIVKGKNWAGETNPNGLELSFKLFHGCKFTTESDWHK